jgi:hypothetical protein
VLGVQRVRGARDATELEAALEALVAPIAPTVQILGAGEAARAWGRYHLHRRGRRAPRRAVGRDGRARRSVHRAAGGSESPASISAAGCARGCSIALWSRNGHTLPAADAAPLVAALAALDDPDTRLADLVVTWNVLDRGRAAPSAMKFNVPIQLNCKAGGLSRILDN